MNEHDLLGAIGQISDAMIDKTALPDACNPDAKPQHQPDKAQRRKPIRQTQKRSVTIHAGAAAAVVALCVALNAAIIYGIVGMRHSDSSGLMPGTQLSDELQDMNQPYMEIISTSFFALTIGVHNPTEQEITYSGLFEIRQYGGLVLSGKLMNTDILTLEAHGYREYDIDIGALNGGGFTLVNLPLDGESEPVFQPVAFEIGVEHSEEVYMPDCTGADYEYAKQLALGMKLYVDKQTAYDDSVPEGCVISMEAGGLVFDDKGCWLNEGTHVTITVSLGALPEDFVPAPRFIGMQWEDALTAAEEADIVLAWQEANSSEPEGTVVTQTTSMGEPVEPGMGVEKRSVILLSVSNGKGTVLMPDLLNLDMERATETALALGLQIRPKRVPDSAPEGTVIAQSIPKDTAIQVGDIITITYSNGMG